MLIIKFKGFRTFFIPISNNIFQPINKTGKYKKMIGIKCPYGVQYREDAVWYTHKCKLN